MADNQHNYLEYEKNPFPYRNLTDLSGLSLISSGRVHNYQEVCDPYNDHTTPPTYVCRMSRSPVSVLLRLQLKLSGTYTNSDKKNNLRTILIFI